MATCDAAVIMYLQISVILGADMHLLSSKTNLAENKSRKKEQNGPGNA